MITPVSISHQEPARYAEVLFPELCNYPGPPQRCQRNYPTTTTRARRFDSFGLTTCLGTGVGYATWWHPCAMPRQQDVAGIEPLMAPLLNATQRARYSWSTIGLPELLTTMLPKKHNSNSEGGSRRQVRVNDKEAFRALGAFP